MQARRSRRAPLAALFVLAMVFSPRLASAQTHVVSSAFGVIPPWTPDAPAPTPVPEWRSPEWQSWDPAFAMQRAQQTAAPGGLRVLRVADAMVSGEQIVRGSCYDWIRTVYERATGRWTDSFRGRIERGPYAQVDDFQPGDWVMFVNEAFGGDTSHTHSAIFVGWADRSQRVATMLSYPGGRRDEPGRYGSYELTRAYRIVRMGDEVPAPRARRRHR